MSPDELTPPTEEDVLLREGVVGAYRLLACLGEGASGRVYEARHEVLGRRVALKVLLPDVATNPDTVSRFVDEARAVNAIRHPGIVDVTDYGVVDGRPYYIMELLEGETLAARLARKGRLEIPAAIAVAVQVAAALGAVHDRGVIHRDLKPENIFLCRSAGAAPAVKILDFGVAKLVGPEQEGQRRTRSGIILGTPLYMSPEQCLGSAALDHRSDVYALGLVLFEMLTGVPPFDRAAVTALLVAHVYETPPSPRALVPEIPEALEAIILRALVKDPAERVGDMRELVSALETALAPPPPPPRVAPPIVARASPPPPAPPPEPESAAASPPTHAEMACTLEGILLKRIREDKLILPAMPATALEAIAELNRPETNPYRVARILGKDPLFVSQILRSASSAAYGGSRVQSLDQAILRIGLLRTRTIVYELSSRQLFQSPRARVRAQMSRVWDHALAVAALARRVAIVIGRALDPEEVYLAGLLQDVGKPVVAAYLLEAERMLALKGVVVTEEVWPPVLERAHRPVGVALAARWNLPLAVQRVIGGCDRYHDEAEGLIVNVVHFAGALAESHEGERSDALDDRIADGAERLRLDWRLVHDLDPRNGARAN